MRASELSEAEWARWFRDGSLSRSCLLGSLGLGPHANVRTQVTRPFTMDGQLPGDVDVLAWDSHAPEKAYALEAKRVRIPQAVFHTHQPGGLTNLRRAAKQVQGLWNLGFHKVGILLFVAIDTVDVHEGAWVSSPPAAVIRAIRTAVETCGVGTLVMEVSQPTKKDVRDTGALGHYWIGRALDQQQDRRITNLLRSGAH